RTGLVVGRALMVDLSFLPNRDVEQLGHGTERWTEPVGGPRNARINFRSLDCGFDSLNYLRAALVVEALGPCLLHQFLGREEFPVHAIEYIVEAVAIRE